MSFNHEIKILRELDHPNLIKFIEIFLTNENIYIITEWYSGGSLKDFIKNSNNFDEQQIKQYFF